MKADIAIRSPLQSDWAYIMDSWKKSFRDSMRRVPRSAYYRQMRAMQTRMRDHAEFRVAFDKSDPDFIWGWACVEDGQVHYCFVRNSRRKDGVAKMLLHGLPLPLKCTHWTSDAADIAGKYPGIAVYLPTALGIEERDEHEAKISNVQR